MVPGHADYLLLLAGRALPAAIECCLFSPPPPPLFIVPAEGLLPLFTPRTIRAGMIGVDQGLLEIPEWLPPGPGTIAQDCLSKARNSTAMDELMLSAWRYVGGDSPPSRPADIEELHTLRLLLPRPA